MQLKVLDEIRIIQNLQHQNTTNMANAIQPWAARSLTTATLPNYLNISRDVLAHAM
jgi:hypothetical protein